MTVAEHCQTPHFPASLCLTVILLGYQQMSLRLSLHSLIASLPPTSPVQQQRLWRPVQTVVHHRSPHLRSQRQGSLTCQMETVMKEKTSFSETLVITLFGISAVLETRSGSEPQSPPLYLIWPASTTTDIVTKTTNVTITKEMSREWL